MTSQPTSDRARANTGSADLQDLSRGPRWPSRFEESRSLTLEPGDAPAAGEHDLASVWVDASHEVADGLHHDDPQRLPAVRKREDHTRVWMPWGGWLRRGTW